MECFFLGFVQWFSFKEIKWIIFKQCTHRRICQDTAFIFASILIQDKEVKEYVASHAATKTMIIVDTQCERVFCLKPQQHVAYSIISQTDRKFLAILPLLLAQTYIHLSSIHKLCRKFLWWFCSLLTFIFEMINYCWELKDFCASPAARNRRVNARRSAAGMALRNAVSCLQNFGLTNDSKCLNLSGDICIYLGEIRHNNFKKYY